MHGLVSNKMIQDESSAASVTEKEYNTMLYEDRSMRHTIQEEIAHTLPADRPITHTVQDKGLLPQVDIGIDNLGNVFETKYINKYK